MSDQQNPRSRAIVAISQNAYPIGTIGWAYPQSRAAGSMTYGMYLFEPDAPNLASGLIGKDDLLIVSDDFTPSAALPGAIVKLAEARDLAQPIEDRYTGMKKAFDRELKGVADERKAINGLVDSAYSTAGLYAIAAYLLSGDTRPDEDVEIKTYDTVEYSPVAALEWAVKNGRIDLLQLDVKAFESSVKSNKVPIEVAIVKPLPKPTIGANLTHRLPVTEE